MVGAMIGGWAMDRMGRKSGIIIGCAGLGVFVGLIGFTPVVVSIILITIAGFFFGFSYIWIIVYIPEILTSHFALTNTLSIPLPPASGAYCAPLNCGICVGSSYASLEA